MKAHHFPFCLYRYLSGNLGLAKLDAVLSPFYRVRLGPDFFDSALPESLVTDEQFLCGSQLK